MAATGIKICEVGLPQSVLKINKTSRLINMAFEMIKFIDGVTYGKNEKILIKIGIHVGKVIAGVIGYHKPQFSLIGDTVNTTSRVCSTGEYGAITLSNEAMIEGKSCDLHFLKKIVSAKGKGDLITWQVNKRTENQRIFKNTVKSIMSSLSETSPIKSRSPAKSSQSPPRKSFFGLNNLINPGSNHDIMKKVANVFQEVGGINSGNEKLLENIEDKENKEVNLEKNDNMSMHIDDKIDDDDDEDDTDYKSSDFKRIYASKYFLITPKVQNQLYDEFLYKLSKDYCKFDRRRVLILCLVYSIRTLMLVSLRKFYINITLVFFFRAIFIALTIFTIYLMNGVTALTLKNKMIKIGIMIAFIFGIISTAVEINNAMIEEDYPMSFLEIILNYIVYSNI